ncbi:MAG: UbiA family prenyltransferase [Calditrichaeota bacterium]|nr:UbiA family prenyltransferase [Calditrichota bacterium]
MLWDYFFLMRPILFFPGWSSLLGGYLVARRPGEALLDPYWISPRWFGLELALALLSFALNMAGTFILNQLRDIESDRTNQKLFFLGEGMIPVKHGIWQSGLTIGAGLIIAAFLGTPFFLFSLAFAVITGFAYNFPPLEMKSYPVRGLLANMAMGWLAFVLGYCLAENPGREMAAVSIPFLAFNTALYLLTTLPDIRGDRATGKNTFPVRYGELTTLLFSAALLLAATGSAFWMREVLLLFPALLALGFNLLALPGNKIAPVLQSVKLGLFSFSVMVCLKLPLYLLLIFLAYFLTRRYYRKRFGIVYPSFGGD